MQFRAKSNSHCYLMQIFYFVKGFKLGIWLLITTAAYSTMYYYWMHVSIEICLFNLSWRRFILFFIVFYYIPAVCYRLKHFLIQTSTVYSQELSAWHSSCIKKEWKQLRIFSITYGTYCDDICNCEEAPGKRILRMQHPILKIFFARAWWP